MAQKGGNRQQKQAAKAVRRKQVVATKKQNERLAASPSGRIAAAAAGPVDRCLRTATMFEAGIGHVVLARRLPSGTLGCGFFLVDLLCLGAKDAYFRELAPSELDGYVESLAAGDNPMVAIDPASAKKLITEAVAFAAESGLSPAKDYRTTVKLFEGIDAAGSGESFAFGRDGRPLFIPGPSDSLTKLREVERALKRTRGDAWDIDPLLGLSLPERTAAQSALEQMLSHDVTGDGLTIEHEDGIDPDRPAPPVEPHRGP